MGKFEDEDENEDEKICARFFPPGWEARLHGRQGCLPPRLPSRYFLPAAK